RRARAEDGYVEIGRRNLQRSVRRFEQHVRQNGDGRALLDHALAELQLFLKIVLGDGQLHGLFLRTEYFFLVVVVVDAHGKARHHTAKVSKQCSSIGVETAGFDEENRWRTRRFSAVSPRVRDEVFSVRSFSCGLSTAYRIWLVSRLIVRARS